MLTTATTVQPIVIIGAGPIGLAAAAHLHERGLPFLVLEAGPSAAAAISDWGHTRLFSPWQYNLDTAAQRLLETGVCTTDLGGSCDAPATTTDSCCAPAPAEDSCCSSPQPIALTLSR